MNTIEEQLDLIEDFDSVSKTDEGVVIRGFMDRYDVDYYEAAEIFTETKKFLALAAEVDANHGQSLFIDQPLLIIDEMWHTFILHTKQYFNFCFEKFNRFIHHRPTPKSEIAKTEKQLQANPTLAIEEAKLKLEKQYSLIYDKYGPETLIKWYEEWPMKYTPEYLNKIKKTS